MKVKNSLNNHDAAIHGGLPQTDWTLFTEQEVSALLKVSLPTLRRWRMTREGPRFVKLGALVRYSRTELEKFLNQVTQGGLLL